jgi:hypothetical protein
MRVDDFLRNFEASSLQAHGAKHILATHTLLNVFFGCHLQEAAQFLVQLPFYPFLSKQRSESVY